MADFAEVNSLVVQVVQSYASFVLTRTLGQSC